MLSPLIGREPERKAEPKAVSVVSAESPPTPPTPPTNNAMYHPSRYKIELCKNFLERGKCEFGDRCLFAHSANELRPCTYRHSKFKTQLCKPFHENGFCDFGSRCSFIHSKPDLYSIVNYLEMVLLSKIPMPENPNHQNDCKKTLLKNEQNVNSLNAYEYTSGELQSPLNRVKRSRLPAFTKLSPEWRYFFLIKTAFHIITDYLILLKIDIICSLLCIDLLFLFYIVLKFF